MRNMPESRNGLKWTNHLTHIFLSFAQTKTNYNETIIT